MRVGSVPIEVRPETLEKLNQRNKGENERKLGKRCSHSIKVFIKKEQILGIYKGTE